MAAVLQSVDQAATAEPPRRRPGGSRVGFTLAGGAIVAGLLLPMERYVTPQNGIGYALGIIGGSMMLALLIYPLRKRKSSLAFLGSIRGWFKVHMILGVVGPLAILYHSNFSLGATNSNIALVCMLVVAGSGLAGRYLYTRIHHGLYGRRASLAELATQATRLRDHAGALEHLPEFLDEIGKAEKRIAEPCLLLARPFLAPWRQHVEQRRLKNRIRVGLEIAAPRPAATREQREILIRSSMRYIDARLFAARRVAEFEASEKLFSAWHILHLPLFFMLVIVGIIHVFAVHVY